MNERNFDLFGHPVEPRKERRGRPRHKPNDSTRAMVLAARERGLNHLQIAAEIRVTAPTLRLNYFTELQSTSITWQRRQAKDAARE